MEYVKKNLSIGYYYCTKQMEKCITVYKFVCDDEVFHCDTTDSIINIMYHFHMI